MKKLLSLKIASFILFCATCLAGVGGFFCVINSCKMPETKAAEQTEILQDAGLGDAGEKIESSESSMKDLGVTYCTLSYTSCVKVC